MLYINRSITIILLVLISTKIYSDSSALFYNSYNTEEFSRNKLLQTNITNKQFEVAKTVLLDLCENNLDFYEYKIIEKVVYNFSYGSKGISNDGVFGEKIIITDNLNNNRAPGLIGSIKTLKEADMVLKAFNVNVTQRKKLSNMLIQYLYDNNINPRLLVNISKIWEVPPPKI